MNIIPNSGIIHVGNLKIDVNKRQVHKDEQRIRLTGIEFSLVEKLRKSFWKSFFVVASTVISYQLPVNFSVGS
jgi:OmpR family response regulator RpaB